MPQDTTSTPTTDHLYHVVFLHPKLGNTHNDRYLLDIAVALKGFGHEVTVYTSSFDDTEENLLDAVNPANPRRLRVKYSGWWLPDQILGRFARTMARLKALCMALHLIMFPPQPRPRIIIMDTEALILALFYWFSTYKTMYIVNLPELHQTETFHKSLRVTSDLLTAKTLGYANEILIQSSGLEEIFHRSFPKINRELQVLHPCYDCGAWKADVIDVRAIIPDLPSEFYLFVAFGEYRKRSNFSLVLDSLDQLYTVIDPANKHKFHLALGGSYEENSREQRKYYEGLVQKLKYKPFASQVTFLKHLPIVYKKTLLDASTALIHATTNDVYPGAVLAAMSLGRIVISVNERFFRDLLIDRISGIHVGAEAFQIARVMDRVAASRNLTKFIGSMARNHYAGGFSSKKFGVRLNELVLKHGRPKYKICL